MALHVIPHRDQKGSKEIEIIFKEVLIKFEFYSRNHREGDNEGTRRDEART